MYAEPVVEGELHDDGTAATYSGAIPSSYGMDFIEVRLDPAVQGQGLRIEFQGEGQTARFNVQVWKLASGEGGPRAVTAQPEVMQREAEGGYVTVISSDDGTAYDRLALIIARLDAYETADPEGNYQLRLVAGGDD